MEIPDTAQTEGQGVTLATQAFTALGWAFRSQSVLDKGVDAEVEMNEDIHATGKLLGLQIKTGSSYLRRSEDDCYVLFTDANHVEYWLRHDLIVLICL